VESGGSFFHLCVGAGGVYLLFSLFFFLREGQVGAIFVQWLGIFDASVQIGRLDASNTGAKKHKKDMVRNFRATVFFF